MLVIFDVRGQQCKECFTDELLLWIMDWYFGKQRFKDKNP